MEDEDRTKGFLRIGLAGGPLVALALWGMAADVGGERLGENGPSLFTPSLVVGAILAVGFGVLCMRSLGEGNSIPILAIGVAAAVVPASLTAFGFLRWYNGMGREDREETLTSCEVTSKFKHVTKRGADSGWKLGYACDVDGEHLYGTKWSTAQPHEEKGDRIEIYASRGKLGIWTRRPSEWAGE